MSRAPHFTAAARAAAAAKRRERAGMAALAFDRPSVFVLRAGTGDARFMWEIRKFGGITLRRGRYAFATSEEARHAGLLALATLADAESAEARLVPQETDGQSGAPRPLDRAPEDASGDRRPL